METPIKVECSMQLFITEPIDHKSTNSKTLTNLKKDMLLIMSNHLYHINPKASPFKTAIIEPVKCNKRSITLLSNLHQTIIRVLNHQYQPDLIDLKALPKINKLNLNLKITRTLWPNQI